MIKRRTTAHSLLAKRNVTTMSPAHAKVLSLCFTYRHRRVSGAAVASHTRIEALLLIANMGRRP
jgi:hypothetical protein